MQLDRTAVTIAQRNILELIDLSFAVVRRYFWTILKMSLIGIVPFAVLNWILLLPLCNYEQLVMRSNDYWSVDDFRLRYLLWMTAIIYAQMPLALCGVTYFVGRAVFMDEPRIRDLVSVLWKRVWSIVFLIGIARFSLLVFVAEVQLCLNPGFAPLREIFLYLFLCGLIMFGVRTFRPFVPEILLLEQCPMFRSKNDKSTVTYSRRTVWLHGGVGTDLILYNFVVSSAIQWMAASILMTFMFTVGVLLGTWRWGWWMDQILFPLAIWIVAIWSTVLRFLIYMNSRIRLEGWEVELRLRAEELRLRERSGRGALT